MKFDQLTIADELLAVAPFTGAWVEIERDAGAGSIVVVAPFTGAWVEMKNPATCSPSEQVAPFTGAWVEIVCAGRPRRPRRMSHPSRVRGLK